MVRATTRPRCTTRRSSVADAMASATDAARTASSSAGLPRRHADLGQAHRPPGPGAHRRPRLVHRQVPGADQQRRRLQRVAPAQRVERVAHVVAAGRHHGAGVEQRAQRRQPPGRGHRLGPALQVQVGLRVGDHGHARGGHDLGDAGLHVGVLDARGSRSGWPRPGRGCGPARPRRRGRAGPSLVGSRVSSVCRSTPTPASAAASTHTRVGARVSASMWGAPPTRSAPAVAARPPAACGWGRRSDPDSGSPISATICRSSSGASSSRTQHEGLDRPQADVAADVDVGAHRRRARGHAQQRRLPGPHDDVVDRLGPAVVAPGDDGAGQVAGRVGDPLADERLVEVGVRLGRGRQQQVAVERFDRRVGADRAGAGGGHGRDAPGAGVDVDVHPAPAGDRGAGEADHPGAPPVTRGSTSPATRWSCSSTWARVRPGNSGKITRCSRPSSST